MDLMIAAAKKRGDAVMGMRCRAKRGELMEEIRLTRSNYKRAWGIAHDKHSYAGDHARSLGHGGNGPRGEIPPRDSAGATGA